MDAVQVVLGLVALAVAVWIAVRQRFQLQQLRRIGEETADTAKKLKADTYTHDLVRTFFGLGQGRNDEYECVFPVRYDRRPLPFIVAGDYHALHVLQNLLGSERLVLRPAPRAPTHEERADPVEVGDDTNVVFLCAPPVNPVLERIAPAIEYLPAGTPSPQCAGIELPCWFVVDHPLTEPGADGTRHVRKRIWIRELAQPLESGAEEDYAEAAALEPWMTYNPKSDVQCDYGILLRLTQGRRKIIVMAGIHQYGTWIVGEFFNLLAIGHPVYGSDVLKGEADFAAVIWGEFVSKQFRVRRCDVLQEYLWTRKGDQWKRVHGSTV